MAIQRKIGTGLVKEKSVRATTPTSITLTETWTGPYLELQIKQDSVILTSKSTALSPTDAGDGELTIVYESVVEEEAELPPPVNELIWSELRLPVQEHPAFNGVSAQRKKEIKAAAESEDGTAPTDPAEKKLYDLLAAGTTEYAIGAPVVRRTQTLDRAPGGGDAWVRATAPTLAPDGYEWLKTANETREESGTYTHTEEWTGAKKWDDILYPAS